MEDSVFVRTESECTGERVSASVYNLVIGAVLCWGFFVNYLMVKLIPYEAIASVPPLAFFIGYIVSCFAGIFMFQKSDSPVISFIGYNLVVIPFGFIINLVVARYNPYIVADAIRITGIVTVFMMITSSMIPRFFLKIGWALTISLIIVIIVEVIEFFIFGMHHGILDWVVAVIFCGYIGYDWARANAIPKTIDNAVDSAASLYIDIINLFLRILRILGRSR